MSGNPAWERWDYRTSSGTVSCEVEVTTGKPFDVLGVKGGSLDDIRDYAAFLRQTAARLYGPGAPTIRREACPICGSREIGADAIAVFGQRYARCADCGHGFVREQPTPGALDAIFRESDTHSAAYVDQAGIEARLAQIVEPKAAWVLAQHQRIYRGTPASALDIGAGGGHFVEAMRRRGIIAAGYERSRASRRFAEKAFGIALRSSSFLDDPAEPHDLLTMWGLLEYVPEPRRFLDKARLCLASECGLLVAEVPRLDCFGTEIQCAAPEAIARHMDPTSHMNAFSDASLATALVETGFRPVAAWYFGMDFYEFLVQAAHRLGDDGALGRLAGLIPAMQASLDRGRQCDDLVIAAVPL
jgi:hypothetical protein